MRLKQLALTALTALVALIAAIGTTAMAGESTVWSGALATFAGPVTGY